MENATSALKIAFAVMVFVISLTVAFSMISQAKGTADAVFALEDESRYFQDGLEGVTYLTAGEGERIVGWESIIPTIYRTLKEDIGVTIVDPTNKDNENYIVARFSIETETIATNWTDIEAQKSNAQKNHINYLNNKVFRINFDDDTWKNVFLRIYKLENNSKGFGAPWLSAKVEDQIERIKVDLYGGEAEYSAGTHGSLNLLGKYKKTIGVITNKKFKESLHIINSTQENGEVKQKVEIIYEVQ